MLQGFEADIGCPSSSSSDSPDKEINKGIAMLHLGRKGIPGPSWDLIKACTH